MTWYWLLATGTEGLQVLSGDAEASATEQRVVQAIHEIATAGEQGEATAGPAGRDGTRTKEGLGDWEPTGQNLPAIPRRIAEKIRRGQYVDFSALPPAAGLSKQPPPHLEGGLVVYKAEDLARSSKIIPDIATWHQCYYLWMTVALKADPSRLQELLSYGYLITKCSKAFKWPSWVMYDQEFRQSRAGNASSRWDQIDTCLYTQLFSGRAEESENWCSHCFTADHSRRRCPFQGQPRRVPGELGASIPGVGGRPPSRASQVCHKFNRFNGDCRRGPDCPYRHICSKCGGAHPVQRCQQQTFGSGAKMQENLRGT